MCQTPNPMNSWTYVDGVQTNSKRETPFACQYNHNMQVMPQVFHAGVSCNEPWKNSHFPTLEMPTTVNSDGLKNVAAFFAKNPMCVAYYKTLRSCCYSKKRV